MLPLSTDEALNMIQAIGSIPENHDFDTYPESKPDTDDDIDLGACLGCFNAPATCDGLCERCYDEEQDY